MRILVLLIVLGALTQLTAQESCPIIPTPAYFESTGEYWEIPQEVKVDFGSLPEHLKTYAQDKFNALYGLELVESGEGAILSFRPDIDLQDDQYTLTSHRGIQITYGSKAGAFYAITSLLQLISQGPEGDQIPMVKIVDLPAFSWRGLHLDVSRHFFTVEEVKRFIDLMALYKFSVFHWHLTDDQGWRLEIKKYPKLTSVGAYRDSTVVGHYNDNPRMYEHEQYGGFYTQDQVKEVIAYAADRFITVVPEIELPGHSRAALAAYPQFSCTGATQGVPGLWGIFDDIYCSKEESLLFLQDILQEVVDLFPSEFIHIGGDEAPKTRWKECAKCQANIQRLGLHDEHELQSYVIRRMDEFLTARGRQLIGWDEILEGGLSPNAAVMSWRGEKGGIEAARQGHPVVMTPTTYCYFDYYQSSHKQEPLGIGGYLPLEKVYNFNVIPKDLEADKAKFVLGGQANLWTEYIPSMSHLEYMTFPRALALAQSVWCQEKPPYHDFVHTILTYQEDYLSTLSVDFSKSIHYPELIVERSEEGIKIGWQGASQDEWFKVEEQIPPFPIQLEHPFDSNAVRNGPAIYDSGKIMKEKDRHEIQRFSPELQTQSSRDNSFRLSSSILADTFYYAFSGSSALGLPIDLVTPPHPKYNHNGSLNLVDGIRGSLPWKGSEWLGFNVPDIELIVDLQERQEVNGLYLGFLQSNGSWIYLPEQVEIFSSADGEKWKPVITEKVAVEDKQTMEYEVFFNIRTRYLKVCIQAMDFIPEGKDGAGNIPWTFIDELTLLFPWEWK